MSIRTTTLGFSGTRAVTAPATWSQLGIWRTMLKTRPDEGTMNIRFTVAVPGGLTVEDVGRVVSEMVSAHEALRTLHPLSADGRLTQVVSRRGDLSMTVLDADESGVTVTDWCEKLADEPFDHAHEVPVRLVLRTGTSGSRELFVALSPLAVDWVAEQLVRQELAWRLSGRRIDRSPRGLNPIDLAISENSESGQAANKAAVARWVEFVDRFDPTNFPVPLSGRPAHRWAGAVLRSARLASAVEQLGSELSVSSAAVHHAASAVMIAALSGRPVAVMHNMTSNRATRAEAECVGRFAQASVSAVEVGSHPFREVVLGTASAGVRSYAMGHYSTADVDAVVDADLFDGFHNSCFHQFRESTAGGSSGAGSALVRDPAIVECEPLSFNTHKFKVEVSHEDGYALVDLVTDRWYLPTSDPQRLLPAMESLIFDAASGADRSAAVSYVERLL